jgi:hypothetical protein
MIVEVHLSYYGYNYQTIVRSHNTSSAGSVAMLGLPEWVDPMQVTINQTLRYTLHSSLDFRKAHQVTNRKPLHAS